MNNIIINTNNTTTIIINITTTTIIIIVLSAITGSMVGPCVSAAFLHTAIAIKRFTPGLKQTVEMMIMRLMVTMVIMTTMMMIKSCDVTAGCNLIKVDHIRTTVTRRSPLGSFSFRLLSLEDNSQGYYFLI